jgi:predicted CXXCH cytochrome family protein
MKRTCPDFRGRRPRALAATLALAVTAGGGAVAAPTASDIVNTKHNLSVSGTGSVRALTETRICIFCHTPHNAAPLTPLWNKELEPQVYTVYTSPTLRSGPLAQPSGPTKLCLSCHDGTIAMGAVLNPAGGITMAGSDYLPPGSLSNFGTDLSGHHPVSFPYHTALPNAELVPSPPADLDFGGQDEVHCITCHDPHNDTFGKFLLKDNRYSALCTTCHQIAGWATSAHAISTVSVEGILPRPPKTYPTWTRLNEWGCEVCHTPHFAPTAEELLNFTSLPPAPFSCTSAGCHTSDPPPPHRTGGTGASVAAIARPDVAAQMRKVSAHRQPPEMAITLRPTQHPGRSLGREVVCADCHNPHIVARSTTEAPYASGMLQGVSGVDRNGAEIRRVTYEYEICFKCHADNTPDVEFVPRVVTETNLRRAFDTSNPSYHPVLGMGRNFAIPSLPSSFEPGMNPSQVIYCTACHADDEGGSKGPHGSSFPPILKRRYETADYTPESQENYDLCYRCHDRDSILSDASFGKKAMRLAGSGGGHSGHLAAGAPCSVCHDPHGVRASETIGAAATGSHAHLINFDKRIVLARTGYQYPIFNDTGTFSGSCTLVCHGKDHDGLSYP